MVAILALGLALVAPPDSQNMEKARLIDQIRPGMLLHEVERILSERPEKALFNWSHISGGSEPDLVIATFSKSKIVLWVGVHGRVFGPVLHLK